MKPSSSEEWPKSELNARQLNIFNSPKKHGSAEADARPYLEELGIEILENRQPIQFTPNVNELVHRWAPYVQGFSASFVQSIFDLYKKTYANPIILDPFSGCGTVLVQSKLNGYPSFGTELNPLLQFIADIKVNCWDVSPTYLIRTYHELPKTKRSPAPSFLHSDSHFNPAVLKNLELLKGGIDSIRSRSDKKTKVKNLLKMAFSSILIDCSNLKRSPCLGYAKSKIVYDDAPFVLFDQKINQIANDLRLIQSDYSNFIHTESHVALANAMDFNHSQYFDLVITSPPYMNGLDYVINYKIEMGWLDFVENQVELKKIKDDMVVCDNVSKGLIRDFSESSSSYTNDWLEEIRNNIELNIKRRGAYRRHDMPYIVHKYFDDMYKVMKKVVSSMKSGSRFILVVGDSLIADVYVPTDLLLAKIGLDLGLEIERIEKARVRRSGQIRSYKLRESILTLIKR
jgi:hypothetical protein